MGPLSITRGDTVLLKYRLSEAGRPKDIKGCRFYLLVDEKEGGPLAPEGHKTVIRGRVEDARRGRFAFTLKAASRPLAGTYRIEMQAPGERITLTPPGGLKFEIKEPAHDF